MPDPVDISAARLRLRSAGYCVICDRIVERAEDGACPEGHPEECVTGSVPLASDEPVPVLPRFNWAAFALPPVWGPAHGLWVGVLFLPIWLFADSALASASRSPFTGAVAVTIMVLTFGFQAFFAKRANGLAWRRVSDRVSVGDFVRRQRVWAFVCVPVGIMLLGWALYYRFVLA